jgi:hypothetical protein
MSAELEPRLPKRAAHCNLFFLFFISEVKPDGLAFDMLASF